MFLFSLSVDFMDCRLQVIKREIDDSNSQWSYRFVVVNSSKSKSYPANFVCMLPIKLINAKGKAASVFGEIFGEKSQDLAIELLNDALKNESDFEVKTEIQRRLKLIDPKQGTVKCNKCKKPFQPRRIKKYKQNFCDDCLKARYSSQKQY
jgi:hypothetical protein